MVVTESMGRMAIPIPDLDSVSHWQTLPMRSWPDDAFEKLGLRNPYAPGNLSIRREAVEQTRRLSNGAVVECGVYRGRTLATIAWLMREFADQREIWGFDSFEGFPPASAEDAIDGLIPAHSQPLYYADGSLEIAQQLIARLGLSDRVRLVKGYFQETLSPSPVERISVLILDCDLYESYRAVLRNLYPRVLSGGWIIFDEYFSPKYPGARRAVDEFFADKPEKPRLATHLLAEHPYERWYVIKV